MSSCRDPTTNLNQFSDGPDFSHVVTAGYKKSIIFPRTPVLSTLERIFHWKCGFLCSHHIGSFDTSSAPFAVSLKEPGSSDIAPLSHASPLALTGLIKYMSLGIALTWQRSYSFAQRPVSQTHKLFSSL